MDELKKGLYNYRTTVTGLLAVLAGAAATAFPEYKQVFTQLSNAFALAFVIFVKDAGTGSIPRIMKPPGEVCPTCGRSNGKETV